MPEEPKILLIADRFRVVEYLVDAGPGQPALKKQVVLHPGAVLIIPMVAEDRVCLIRNYRVAVGKTLIELPAGTLDRDEPPRATAVRELKEETGYEAQRWQELPAFFMSPGILNERMYLYVAQDLTSGEPAREPGEEIENLVVDWSEAVRMAEQGEIEDAKSLVAILLWDRLRRSA